MSELMTGPTDDEKALFVQEQAYRMLIVAKSVNWERVEPALKISIVALLDVINRKVNP